MIKKLERYAQLEIQAENIRAEMQLIKDELQTAVTETNAPLSAYGLIAHMKPGRKSINYEQAVKARMEEYNEHAMHSLAWELDELIGEHSTTKVTVKWEQVTKKAGIDTSSFVTEAPAVFVVERVE